MKGLRVEALDDFLGVAAVGEFDESEAAGAARFAIDRHDNVGRLSDGREVGAKIRLRGAVRKVPDEQTDCQGLLVKGESYPRTSLNGSLPRRKSRLPSGAGPAWRVP